MAERTKIRESGIELLRIIAVVLIVSRIICFVIHRLIYLMRLFVEKECFFNYCTLLQER